MWQRQILNNTFTHACSLLLIFLSLLLLSAVIFHQIVILPRCLFYTQSTLLLIYRNLLPSLNQWISYSFINMTSKMFFSCYENCWRATSFSQLQVMPALCLYCRSQLVCSQVKPTCCPWAPQSNLRLFPLHWKSSNVSVWDAPSATKVSSTHNFLADKTHYFLPIVKSLNLRLTCLGKNTAMLDKNFIIRHCGKFLKQLSGYKCGLSCVKQTVGNII